jgi:hypothetical protein
MESRQSLEGIGSIHVGSRNVGSNEEYDPATNTWRECARMPRGLNHIGAVGLGGKVFCIGGFIEQSQTAAPECPFTILGQIRGRNSRPCPNRSASTRNACSRFVYHCCGTLWLDVGWLLDIR